MRSSSPAESSPSKSPFTSSASRRFNSKVYSRRATLGSSAAKRARKAATPDTDKSSDGDDVEADEPEEKVDVQRRIMSYKDREEVRLRDGLLSSPHSKTGPESTRRTGRLREAGNERKGGSADRTASPAYAAGANRRGLTSAQEPFDQGNGHRLTTYGKRQTAPIWRTDTEISVTSAPDLPTPTLAPPITVQPATSSPSVLPSSQATKPTEAPSTPPRKRVKRNPLTPKSSPRDLASLFAPVSPAKSPGLRRTLSRDDPEDAGPSKRGGGLLRKMLDKTQSLGGMASPAKSTEEVEDYFGPRSGSTSFTPSKNLARTYSLPSTPSKTPAKEEPAIQATSLIVPIAMSSRVEPTASGSGGRGKRTYGRQRTMLAAAAVNDSPRSGVSSLGEKEVVKESYAELRKQFEVDNTGGDDIGQGSFMLDLLAVRGGQSVSDLRSKGENRRFMDELGYMVDPILDQSTSIGLKRSSIFDILRSMQEGEWLHRAKICGQVERIWQAMYDAIGSKGDELIEAMCLLYLINLVKSGSGLELVLRSHDESCVKILLDSLKMRVGPLDATTKSKMTGLVVKVRNMYQKLELGWTSTTISTKRLASFLLVEITTPTLWTSSSEALSADKALSRVCKSLGVEVDALSGRFGLAEKGLDLLPETKTPDIDHIAQCLTVICRMISREIAERQSLMVMVDTMAAVVVNALISGVHLALNDTERVQQTGVVMTIQSLQILAAISTVSSEWAETITQLAGGLTALARVLLYRSILGVSLPEAPSIADIDPFLSPRKTTQRLISPSHGEPGEEDLLCLVLAILTTAVTGSEQVRDALAVLHINSTCRGAKSCLRRCTCDSAELFVGLLVQIYIEHTTSESPTASLIAAYLALLLAKLLLHPHSRPTILEGLPGETDQLKLSRLIEVLSDLGGLQNLLHDRMRDVVAQSGEEVEGGGGGDEGVVHDAIEDLRGLMTDMA